MAGVGVSNPVTKGNAGSAYHRELAKQIATFLKVPFQRVAVITLADVYCLYNRARGTDMVSPDDVAVACRLFDSSDAFPMGLKTFPSGVSVVQSALFSDAALDERMLAAVDEAFPAGGISAAEWGRQESVGKTPSGERRAVSQGVSLYMARDQLAAAELRGVLARCADGAGDSFWRNKFLE